VGRRDLARTSDAVRKRHIAHVVEMLIHRDDRRGCERRLSMWLFASQQNENLVAAPSQAEEEVAVKGARLAINK
jgi:hypothetical protein